MAHPGDTAEATSQSQSGVSMVDPRAPRFGQTVTMTVLLVAIALQAPVFVLAVAVVLNVAVLSSWRANLYGLVWRRLLIPVVGRPHETEPAAPHRFASLMGAGMSLVATALLFGAPALDVPALALAGYAVALVHAGMAAIGGVGDYCIGCKMYRKVAYVRRLGLV